MQLSQKIEFRKTRDFGDKFNATFEFIRQNYKGFLPPIIFISLPLIVSGMAIIGYFTYFRDGMGDPQNPFALFQVLGKFLGLGLLACGLIIAGYLLNASLVYNYMKLYMQREYPSIITMKELWDEAKKDVGNIFVAILLSLIVVGVGLLFLVIPGFYLMVVLSLMVPIIIFERRSVGDAFSRCFFLIKDKWWSTFGVIIVASMIQGTVGIIFNIPQYILMFTSGLFDMSGDFYADMSTWKRTAFVLSQCLSAIGSALLYCISHIALAFQYFNLVERREATGLMGRIENFGTSNAPLQDPKESY